LDVLKDKIPFQNLFLLGLWFVGPYLYYHKKSGEIKKEYTMDNPHPDDNQKPFSIDSSWKLVDKTGG